MATVGCVGEAVGADDWIGLTRNRKLVGEILPRLEGFQFAAVDRLQIDGSDVLILENLAGDPKLSPALERWLVRDLVDAVGGAGDELFGDAQDLQDDERCKNGKRCRELAVLLSPEGAVKKREGGCEVGQPV